MYQRGEGELMNQPSLRHWNRVASIFLQRNLFIYIHKASAVSKTLPVLLNVTVSNVNYRKVVRTSASSVQVARSMKGRIAGQGLGIWVTYKSVPALPVTLTTKVQVLAIVLSAETKHRVKADIFLVPMGLVLRQGRHVNK